MRTKEFIELNGKAFEISAKASDVYFTYTNIWSAYENPSFEKEKVWNEWVRWGTDIGAWLAVESKNTSTFTISGMVMIDGVRRTFKITPSHNYIW